MTMLEAADKFVEVWLIMAL